MTLFAIAIEPLTMVSAAALGFGAWTIWAMVGWDRAADAAERWKGAAHAYAKALRDQRAMGGPVLTRLAPEFHAPSEARNSEGFVGRAADDPLDVHVRPTRVLRAPWAG